MSSSSHLVSKSRRYFTKYISERKIFLSSAFRQQRNTCCMSSTFFSLRYTFLEIIKSSRIYQSCYYMHALRNFSLEGKRYIDRKCPYIYIYIYIYIYDTHTHTHTHLLPYFRERERSRERWLVRPRVLTLLFRI
jgi:hypothetical protein